MEKGYQNKIQDILIFYIKKLSSQNQFIRTFSENILLTFSLHLNSPFLILKGLIYVLDYKVYSKWLVILMKRPLSLLSNEFKRLSLIKLVETMIEIAIIFDGEIYKLIEENIRILIYFNMEKNYLGNFILSGVIKILEEKIGLKRYRNFTRSILSLISILISSNLIDFQSNFLKSLDWTISEFSLKISNFNLIYLGNLQTECLILLRNISEKIGSQISSKDSMFNTAINALIMIRSFYFLTFYPIFFNRSFWKLTGILENKFLILFQNYDKNAVIFFPIFLGFYFLDLSNAIFYVNVSKTSLLDLTFLLNNFTRILNLEKISKIILLVFKNLCYSRNIPKLSDNHHIKFFSIGEKLNCINRKLYFDQIICSFESEKNKIQKSQLLYDFIEHVFKKDFDLFGKINAFFLTTTLKNNYRKKIDINRFNLQLKEEILKILQINNDKVSKKEFIFILDFWSNARYCIPLKKIVIFFNIISQKQIGKEKGVAHFINFFDRILSMRGNDGEGVQLLDIYNLNLKKKISFSNLEINYSDCNKESKEIFLKLLIKTLAKLNREEIFEKNLITNLIMKILKKSEIETQNLNSMIFLMESIILLIKNSNLDLYELSLNFGIFNNQIIKKNQKENLPFIFEIFTELIMLPGNNRLNEMFIDFFKSVCNPYIWYNNSLLNSMVKFIKVFVEKYSTFLSFEAQLFILKIMTFLIKKQKKKGTEYLLKIILAGQVR